MVGNGQSRELCEALELARCTLHADYFRFLSSNHSRPVAATIKTTMMLHGVDEAGSSASGGAVGFALSVFFGAGSLIGDVEFVLLLKSRDEDEGAEVFVLVGSSPVPTAPEP